MIDVRPFGTENAALYCLHNTKGMQVTVTNFGARLVDILLPVDGVRSVSLAVASDDEYRKKDVYVGSTVAPVAGRIAGAMTDIKGKTYRFTENEPGKTLHSGINAANEQYWEAKVDEEDNQVDFYLTLPDDYNGFPGPVDIRASYQLTEENEIRICYWARSEKDTIFNPTNHVYFNLSGDFGQSVAGHQLKIDADQFVPLGGDNLPTGDIQSVADTPFDFRQFARIGQGFESRHPQNQLVNGYDHPWLINQSEVPVEVVSPDGKIRLLLRSNQPAVIVYTYNHGPTAMTGRHTVFSLECQGLPNACNVDHFGSILLEKGDEFLSEFSYQFLF